MTRVIFILAVALSGTASAAACSELPVLFIVQDKSGSMNFDPTGAAATATSPSKWSAAQSVVPALANQFDHRFRFGALMYPASTTQFNCDVGVLKTPVSDNAKAIGTSYSAALAGGGTPTATSLTAAKTYLQGLHLTTPAYVLLITDGLPNCNSGLNVNTCTFTTPKCDVKGCGFGALDCLDDQGTIAAAQALFAANIRVFVVGFDPSLTSGNNLAVLNAIASAGGTTKAYTASNKTQLADALNAIALNTATCCKDACTAGATQCGEDGTAQTCAFDAVVGCTVWNSQSCGATKSCNNGSCASTCTNACTAGAKRCTNQSAEQCVTGGNGCTSWVAGTTCDSGRGEQCVDGSCKATVCKDACVDGAVQCGSAGPQVCVKVTACTAWQDLAACDSKSMCVTGKCRPKCTGELASCLPGNTCTDGPGGKACLPTTGSGSVDAGVGGSGGVKDITARAGCGCQSVDSGFMFAALALAMRWARRRKA